MLHDACRTVCSTCACDSCELDGVEERKRSASSMTSYDCKSAHGVAGSVYTTTQLAQLALPRYVFIFSSSSFLS